MSFGVGRVSWIRTGIEVVTPSGRPARVIDYSQDGFLQLTYMDRPESVRLHARLVAPRNAEPVRVGCKPSFLASEIRAWGLPRPGKG